MFIRSPDQRTEFGVMLRSQLLNVHTAEGWVEALTNLYSQTDTLFIIHDDSP